MTMVSRTTNCWPLLVADASAAATAADAAAVAVAAAVDAAADVGWCWWWWLSRSPPVGSLWYLELKSPPLLGFIMVVARSQSPAPVHTRISTRWVGGYRYRGSRTRRTRALNHSHSHTHTLAPVLGESRSTQRKLRLPSEYFVLQCGKMCLSVREVYARWGGHV